MKKYIFLIYAGGLLAFSPGTTAFPLLRVSFGARASALGECFTASYNDGGVLWWNPGALGFVNHSEFFGTQNFWFLDIKDDYVGTVIATRRGVMGSGFVYSWIRGIEIYDENNYFRGNDGKVNSWIFQLAYGKKFSPVLSMGIGIKYFRDNVIDVSGTGYALDLGIFYKAGERMFWGASVRNIGPSMRYTSGVSFPLPLELRVGGQVGIKHNNNLFFDICFLPKTGILFGIGDEVWIKDVLALRAGYKYANQLNKLTFGCGLNLKILSIDYSYSGYGILGSVHRVWLSKSWGELVPFGDIIVKVIDKRTRKPLEAFVQIKGVIEKNLKTDRLTGIVKITGIPAGEIKIRAERKKYIPVVDTAYVEVDRVKLKVIELSRVPFASIRGEIKDAGTGKPLASTIIYDGPVSGEAYSDSVSGTYALLKLEPGRYRLKIKPENRRYISQEKEIVIKPGEALIQDFELVRKGETIILKGVNFETGKATLLPESYPILDNVARILLNNPDIKVEIAGHTDNVPIHTKEFPSNLELSQARAEAVKNYFIKKYNISPERLIARGYGDTQPIASNATEEGRAKNRRVEFRIIE